LKIIFLPARAYLQALVVCHVPINSKALWQEIKDLALMTSIRRGTLYGKGSIIFFVSLSLEGTNFEPQLYQSKPNQAHGGFQVHSKPLKHHLGLEHHQDARDANYKATQEAQHIVLGDTMI
jgi:hypothetical protein